MQGREILTRRVRVSAGAALSAVATAVALSACGGGGTDTSASTASAATAAHAAAAAGQPLVAAAHALRIAAASAGVLFQSDFEAGMGDWVNWANAQVVDGAGAAGSSRALRVGTAAGGAADQVPGILAGTTYHVTAQAKVSDPSEVVYLGINILDQANTRIAQQVVSVTTTDYSLATADVAAPAGAAKAEIFVWKNAGSGFAFIDNVTLAPADAAATASANLVSNAGFENGLTDWSNWGNAAVTTGQASSGTSSVRVGTSAGGLGHPIAGVSAGTSYTLTGNVKVTDPSETAFLGVSFIDQWGIKLLDRSVPVTSTSYTAAKLDVVAPANTATALVYVWKNAGSGFADVDDVSLAPSASGTATPTAPAPAPAAPASSPAPAPAATPASAPASAPATAASAPAAPSSAGTNVGEIPLGTWPTTLLQVGNSNDAYFVEDAVWAPWGLTRGSYTGVYGTSYEQYTGVSPNIGPNGEVGFRMAWKWPQCCNEIKSFPSIVSGRKPGWFNTWTKPGGYDVLLPDGSYSQTFPSGATPGTFLPLQLPVASLKTSFNYTHMTPPNGRGHLAYDIFLQNTPQQANGFGINVTHEIMIPLDYWGGYGQYPTRNPAWYDHDVTIDGILFHIYVVKDSNGVVTPTFAGGWKFIVFEPDQPIQPGTLDLAKFINYTSTQHDTSGAPWTNGNEWAVSVELGAEVAQGEGDIQVSNYRVWH
jgi:hypothetical protein